jgi:adenylate cyclase
MWHHGGANHGIAPPVRDHGRMDADDWEAAGLYDRSAAGAEQRRAVLEYLCERGATLHQLVEAHHLGSLPAVAASLTLGREVRTVPVAEMAGRCGVPVERLRRVLLAAGLPVTADGEVAEDLVIIMAAFKEGAALLGEDATLAFTRVLGASATNIAEAAVALFYSELGPGSGREGEDELTRARHSEAATRAFAGVPAALSALVLAQFERATRRAYLARGGSSTSGEAPAVGSDTEVVALGFVDLVGSTRWAEELSLRDQSLALSRFESAAWSSAVLAGGRVVKMIGDEVFFAAASAAEACRIGIEICRAAAADPVLPSARGAIGYGAAIPREGDYFGPLVNLVAHLVKVAAPGELVVTAETAAALPADQWSLRALGSRAVRGLPHPEEVFALTDLPG